ncbi:MAG: ATP-binding cassette domain-containing protein, partial [Escherichia coli]
VDKLHQYYGGSHILRGLSFEAKVGEVTCLLGRNGVGKTTLLRCLMGLVPAREGQVAWEGRSLTGLRPHQRVRAGIAYVPLMWVINEINRGELEILLPRYQSDPRPVYALYTEKDKLPLKVQVVINSLTDYFVEVGKLFQEMHGRGKEK